MNRICYLQRDCIYIPSPIDPLVRARGVSIWAKGVLSRGTKAISSRSTSENFGGFIDEDLRKDMCRKRANLVTYSNIDGREFYSFFRVNFKNVF